MAIFSRFRIPDVYVYTDGSCNNEGQGGWAAVILHNNSVIEICGSEDNTTNNRMELTAVLEALKRIDEDVNIILYSDSQYVVKGTENVFDWRKANWVTKSSGPVKNKELWQQFVNLVSGKNNFKAVWVRGHNDVLYNERCDVLAKKERDKLIKTKAKIKLRGKEYAYA